MKLYSKGEEVFNGVTHIVGAAIGIIYLVLGIIFAAMFQSYEAVLAVVIFGISIIILYLMSTIYHMLNPMKAKKVFQIFDHCTIFLLIAGTYTPFIVLGVPTLKGYIILGIVWFFAILGITFNAISLNNKIIKISSYVLYIFMGWCIIFIFKDLIKFMRRDSLILLFLGGVLYTVGFIFFGLGKKVKWFHSIWHLFVLCGTILHAISSILLLL